MKTTIRRGVFETNSSSVHSISICMKSDFERWKAGEIILYGTRYSQRLDTLEAVKKAEGMYFDEDNVYTYDKFMNNEWLEPYVEEYKLPTSDETVVAFGWYGYDG